MTSTRFRLLTIGGLLLLQASQIFALPECPESGYRDNCFGSTTFASGSKYVGEFKSGKKNGRGLYTHVDGTFEKGFFQDDKFLYESKVK
jgi:hypothetical protein